MNQNIILNSPTISPKKKPLIKRIWRCKWLYLFLLPAFIWYIIFCYYPMAGLILIFKEYSFKDGIFGSDWSNPLNKSIRMFFDNPLVWQMIRNTVIVSTLRILTFPIPIILALMLNEVKNPTFKKIVQTVTYFPFFISWAIIVSILEQLLTPYGAGGPLYTILTLFDSSNTMVYFMQEAEYFYPILILSLLWKTMGWNSIIYLAAMTNINPELYEAAKLDGANRMQLIRYITIPSIRVTIGLLFILSLGSIMNAGYEQIYLMQTPANYELSNVLDVYVVTMGVENGYYSLATFAGLFQGLINLAIVIVANAILRKKADIALW